MHHGMSEDERDPPANRAKIVCITLWMFFPCAHLYLCMPLAFFSQLDRDCADSDIHHGLGSWQGIRFPRSSPVRLKIPSSTPEAV